MFSFFTQVNLFKYSFVNFSNAVVLCQFLRKAITEDLFSLFIYLFFFKTLSNVRDENCFREIVGMWFYLNISYFLVSSIL